MTVRRILNGQTLCILETPKTLANSEDTDEMQHNAAFHQGLHCLLRLNQPSGTEMCHTCGPLKYTMGSYCINMYGKVDQNTNRLKMHKIYIANSISVSGYKSNTFALTPFFVQIK